MSNGRLLTSTESLSNSSYMSLFASMTHTLQKNLSFYNKLKVSWKVQNLSQNEWYDGKPRHEGYHITTVAKRSVTIIWKTVTKYDLLWRFCCVVIYCCHLMTTATVTYWWVNSSPNTSTVTNCTLGTCFRQVIMTNVGRHKITFIQWRMWHCHMY